jgi:hypothetical protein
VHTNKIERKTKNYTRTQDNGVIQLAAAAGAAHILELTKKALKEAGATSEETAKTPEELKLDKRWRVAWLKMSANTIIPSGVVATKDGRYYLISKNEKQR